MKKLLVIGAGGHSKVVIDIIRQNMEFDIVGLIDKDRNYTYLNYSVIGDDEDLFKIKAELNIGYAFVALGSNAVRKKVTEHAIKLGFCLINVISKYAVVSETAELGMGNVIMPGAILNAQVKLGNHCIVNTNASVDHDCIVGDYVHIAPGCAISGNTQIGNQCFLGTGTKVIDNIKVAEQVVSGAGSVIVRDIPVSCKVVGVPARVVQV